MDFPSVAKIAELLGAGGSKDAPTPTPVADVTAAAADLEASRAPAADNAKIDSPATRTSDDGASGDRVSAAATALAAALESSTAEGAEAQARRLIESLPEATRGALSDQLYRNLHRTLSERDKAHSAELRQIREQNGTLSSKLEELLTSGMTEAELNERREAQERTTAAETGARAERERANFGRALDILEKAGYVWDLTKNFEDQDPRILALDWGQGELDVETGLARLTRSIIAAGPVTPVRGSQTPSPRSPQARTFTEAELEAEAERRARDRVRRSGVLTADTGRPGGGAGAPNRTPTDFAGTRSAVESALRERLGSRV